MLLLKRVVTDVILVAPHQPCGLVTVLVVPLTSPLCRSSKRKKKGGDFEESALSCNQDKTYKVVAEVGGGEGEEKLNDGYDGNASRAHIYKKKC